MKRKEKLKPRQEVSIAVQEDSVNPVFLILLGILIFLLLFVLILLAVNTLPKGGYITISLNATNATSTANMTSSNNTTNEGSYWVPYVPTTEDEDDWASSDDDWVILPAIAFLR